MFIPCFLRAKRIELKGAEKKERLWLSLVSLDFAPRSSRVRVSKEKEETARNRILMTPFR